MSYSLLERDFLGVYDTYADASLVELFGQRDAGVSADRVEYLLQEGLLAKKDLPGRLVLGVDAPVDPWQFAILMGALTAAESGRETHLAKGLRDIVKMRTLSLKQWANKVNTLIAGRLFNREPDPTTFNWLTEEEQAAWAAAKHRSLEYMQAATKKGREAVARTLREELAEGVRLALPPEKVAARLARKAQKWNWASDWDRVARTELQAAYNDGVVTTAIKSSASNRIARIPETGACQSCRRLLLDRSGIPIVWDIATITANGTNIGKAKSAWMATVWPIHPNCRCGTIVVPEGQEFDNGWNLVQS